MANDEINVPSLVLILVVSGLLLRHFFFRGQDASSSAGGAATSAGAAAGRGTAGSRQAQAQELRRVEALNRRTEAAVEQIQQIFPDADRREIWWDLRRSNLNVAATTERILAGRLETPPVTFQPPPRPTSPSASRAGTASANASGPRQGTAGKSAQPNLIERYHLQNRVGDEASSSSSSEPSPAAEAASSKPAKSWSTNKEERQSLLKKRRDEMILEARRKMAAKIAAEKTATEKTN